MQQTDIKNDIINVTTQKFPMTIVLLQIPLKSDDSIVELVST